MELGSAVLKAVGQWSGHKGITQRQTEESLIHNLGSLKKASVTKKERQEAKRWVANPIVMGKVPPSWDLRVNLAKHAGTAGRRGSRSCSDTTSPWTSLYICTCAPDSNNSLLSLYRTVVFPKYFPNCYVIWSSPQSAKASRAGIFTPNFTTEVSLICPK